MFAGAGEIRECLGKLGALLDRHSSDPVTVLICGGSALNLSGLSARTTTDVDALGIVGSSAGLGPLPGWLLRYAEDVAGESGLEETWFNDAASALQSVGLPSGILQRATRERFGARLEVAIASRLDLIALKCLAALDPKTGRIHLGIWSISPQAPRNSLSPQTGS